MKRALVWVSVLSFVCGVLVVGSGEVAAGANRVERRYAGKILLLKKKPPSYFKTKGGFAAFLRNHSITKVHEGDDKTWRFETMAFFKRPLNDYEVEMVFYDVQYGTGKSQRQFVTSYSMFTQDRNTRSISGKTMLPRPDFDANKKYQIVAQNRGVELSRSKIFATYGTSQAAIEADRAYKATMKEMEKSIKDLEKRAQEQKEAEEKRKKKSKKAADDLF